MKKLLILFVVSAAGSACLNPLLLRRAQTLKPGEMEVVVAPEVFGAPLDSGTTYTPETAIGPSLTVAGRMGVAENLDVGLKLDPGLYPEINVGYQIMGQKPEDIKLTLSGGVRAAYIFAPNIAAGGNKNAFISSAPLGVLVDIPFGEHALYTGVRVAPTFAIGGNDTGTAFAITVDPIINLGLSFAFGNFHLQPELAVKQEVGLINGSGFAPGLGFTQYSLALGFGWRFGG